MSGIHHMSLDIRGALMNWSDQRFRGIFKHDDGRTMTVQEAKGELLDRLARGELFIPCTDKCDNFDPKVGCLGHRESSQDNRTEKT